jgi:aminoglycoside 6-adenylyltransferase
VSGDEDDVLARAVRWAEHEDALRALIIESSRAAPGAPLDALSDYDLLLVVSDIARFRDDDAWLRWCGEPLVRFSEDWTRDGFDGVTRLVLYSDGTKVDHQVWPVQMLRAAASQPKLPDILDVGYRVLVDKGGVTKDLGPPSYSAHIPQPPTEAEYRALIEEFWWESTYVAKGLARRELFPWKYSFDVVMRFELLRKMLEWRVELAHDWSLRPGTLGRHLKDRVPPDVWAEVEATFAGPDVDDNWDALNRMGALFRRLAKEVGTKLGYAYPDDLDRGMVDYWHKVRELEL